MTQADWERNGLRAFGMLLRGDRIRGVNVRGERRSDDTFLLVFNKGNDPVTLALPTAEAGDPVRWEPVEPFDDVEQEAFAPDEPAELEAHALLVLRAVPA